MMSYKFSDLYNLIDVLMVYELVFHIHDLCGLHGHFTYSVTSSYGSCLRSQEVSAFLT